MNTSIKLEKDKKLVESRLKLNYINRNEHSKLLFLFMICLYKHIIRILFYLLYNK